MQTTATELNPAARASRSAPAMWASSSGVTTAPSAPVRSSASMTRAYSSSGSRIWRSKIRGRFW